MSHRITPREHIMRKLKNSDSNFSIDKLLTSHTKNLLRYGGWGVAIILGLTSLVYPLLYYGGHIVAIILAVGVIILCIIGAITELAKVLRRQDISNDQDTNNPSC